MSLAAQRMKYCSGCKQSLPINKFHASSSLPGGAQHFCISCSSKKKKEARNKKNETRKTPMTTDSSGNKVEAAVEAAYAFKDRVDELRQRVQVGDEMTIRDGGRLGGERTGIVLRKYLRFVLLEFKRGNEWCRESFLWLDLC